MSLQKPAKPARVADFEHQAIRVLKQLQASLRRLIQATPGLTERPADLCRTLGVQPKLAWQMHTLAHAENPLTQASKVPKPAATKRFLEAAARRGAPHDRILKAQQAYEQLQELIRQSAGNRDGFDSMISGLSPRGLEQVDLIHKRAAFKAQSHFQGVQARTQLSCFALHPSKIREARLDGFSIRGLVDLRRLRSDASWIISTTRISDDHHQVVPMNDRELFDGDSDANPCGLLKQFCSQPLPRFTTTATGAGYLNVELVGTSIGNVSAVTSFNGDIWRGKIPRYRDGNDHEANFRAKIRTPCEVLVLDVMVHESIFGRLDPRTIAQSDHRAGELMETDDIRDVLRIHESITYLGKGLHVGGTPEVPRYSEMLSYAFERMGWDGQEFDVYRCRVEYPLVPSTVIVQFDLPEKPGG